LARPCLAIPDEAVDPEYIALNISSVCPLPAKDTLPPGLFSVLSTSAGFSRDEFEFYCSLLKKRIVKKKEHYLQAGEISRATAYVASGCLRQYIIGDHGKEIIIQFALEDWWIGDLESFHYEKPSTFYIQALEDSELMLLSRRNFLRVCEELPKYKSFHDEKVQRNHFATLKRLSLAKLGTPEEKYLLLMKEQPQLFQRVPLHYIASFLSIEPESLSRLRKRLSEKPRKS
jgi:CRP/FNR family transcriptional regulator, cyclic AMP receptor protein